MKPRLCPDCGAPTGRKYAKYCDVHRWQHRGKTPKYRFTPEMDAHLRTHYTGAIGQPARLAALWGVPKWVVTNRAQFLGVARHGLRGGHRAWSDEDTSFVQRHAGLRHVEWIARKLRRTVTSVAIKITRLGLTRKLDHGFTARQVADGIGVDSHVVGRWVERGWLVATRHEQNGGPYPTYEIWPHDVRRFVMAHPAAFRLDRVDQLWFLDIVFHGALGERRESAA